MRLQCNKWGLEKRSKAHSSDDLIEDKFRPSGVYIEVDEETKAYGHDQEAGIDGRKISAVVANEDASGERGCGSCEGGGEEVYTREDGGGPADGLEV